jgi:hypothetical protein
LPKKINQFSFRQISTRKYGEKSGSGMAAMMLFQGQFKRKMTC